MNSTSVSLSSQLSVIQYYMGQYALASIIIIGSLGNISNLIIFSQKTLRTNVCSWYFILFSIGNLLTLYFGCFPRVMTLLLGYDLARISVVFCKLRVYVLTCGLNLSRNFMALISIDRWMITSRNVRIRRLSSSKVAILLIIITISFWVILDVNVVIGYTINTNAVCSRGTSDSYALTYIIFGIISTIGPLITMIIFSILSVLNVRKTIHQRIQPATIRNNTLIGRQKHYHRKDLALIRLSFMQVIVYSILNLLDMYNTIYGFASLKSDKTSDRTAIDAFTSTIGIYLIYLYSAVSYLFN